MGNGWMFRGLVGTDWVIGEVDMVVDWVIWEGLI